MRTILCLAALAALLCAAPLDARAMVSMSAPQEEASSPAASGPPARTETQDAGTIRDESQGLTIRTEPPAPAKPAQKTPPPKPAAP